MKNLIQILERQKEKVTKTSDQVENIIKSAGLSNALVNDYNKWKRKRTNVQGYGSKFDLNEIIPYDYAEYELGKSSYDTNMWHGNTDTAWSDGDQKKNIQKLWKYVLDKGKVETLEILQGTKDFWTIAILKDIIFFEPKYTDNALPWAGKGILKNRNNYSIVKN